MAQAFPVQVKKRWRVRVTPLRIMGAVVLAAVVIVGGGAWFIRSWTPSPTAYPVQGITLNAASGEINWRMAKAAGADFAYVRATNGAGARDPSFDDYLAGAQRNSMPVGAIHRYDLCRRASEQATRFIATVPRDADMLPPAVELDFTETCTQRPNRDTLLAELNTFLNQIETHSAKPVAIRTSLEFEAVYDIAGGINRSLWVEGNFFPPDYATRRWVMWTASTHKRVNGIEGPIEWNVVRP